MAGQYQRLADREFIRRTARNVESNSQNRDMGRDFASRSSVAALAAGGKKATTVFFPRLLVAAGAAAMEVNVLPFAILVLPDAGFVVGQGDRLAIAVELLNEPRVSD